MYKIIHPTTKIVEIKKLSEIEIKELKADNFQVKKATKKDIENQKQVKNLSRKFGKMLLP